jgi:hypothetical protein
MVQVVFPFPCIVAGVQDSDETTVRAATVRVLDSEAPFNVAVTVTVWLPLTVVAVVWNVAVVAPAPTVTDAGTVRVFEVAATATMEPPRGCCLGKSNRAGAGAGARDGRGRALQCGYQDGCIQGEHRDL